MSEYQTIGGLWQKTSKGGRPYLSGKVTLGGVEYHITVWENAYKLSTADRVKPDLIVQTIVTEPEGEKQEHPF